MQPSRRRWMRSWLLSPPRRQPASQPTTSWTIASPTTSGLETGLASPEAIRLYARLGYRETGPFGTYVDNGSSVYMEKAPL